MSISERKTVAGRAVVLPGNDIDTDRIIPARFLRCVVFEGLGEHVFEDDRAALRAQSKVHPFDEPGVAGAQVLLVNKNFGCGSSREHAPQALMRWGIRAVVGESFAEIFFGNCLALGIPCVTVSSEDIKSLMQASHAAEVKVDLQTLSVHVGDQTWPCSLAAGPREQLVQGRWDTTAELLAAKDQTLQLAATLPYMRNWSDA